MMNWRTVKKERKTLCENIIIHTPFSSKWGGQKKKVYLSRQLLWSLNLFVIFSIRHRIYPKVLCAPFHFLACLTAAPFLFCFFPFHVIHVRTMQFIMHKRRRQHARQYFEHDKHESEKVQWKCFGEHYMLVAGAFTANNVFFFFCSCTRLSIFSCES